MDLEGGRRREGIWVRIGVKKGMDSINKHMHSKSPVGTQTDMKRMTQSDKGAQREIAKLGTALRSQQALQKCGSHRSVTLHMEVWTEPGGPALSEDGRSVPADELRLVCDKDVVDVQLVLGFTVRDGPLVDCNLAIVLEAG